MSTTDLRILLIRIEELELANRKLKLQMRKWKKQVREKEKARLENLFLKKVFLGTLYCLAILNPR